MTWAGLRVLCDRSIVAGGSGDSDSTREELTHAKVGAIAPVDLTTTMKSFVPGPGGTRFRIVQFPGASNRPFESRSVSSRIPRQGSRSRRVDGTARLRDAYNRFG